MKNRNGFLGSAAGVLAAGVLSTGVAFGLGACGGARSAGGGASTGIINASLAAARGAELEGALIAVISNAGFADATAAGAGYVSRIGSDCAENDAGVVTIELPCEDKAAFPEFTEGVIEVTLSGTGNSIAIETLETVVSEDGVEIDIVSSATHTETTATNTSTWNVTSGVTATLDGATASFETVTDGHFTLTRSSNCGTYALRTDPETAKPLPLDVSMDIPDGDDFDGQISYSSFSMCWAASTSIGYCPKGSVTAGISSTYQTTTAFTSTVPNAVVTLLVGGTASGAYEFPLECTPRP